MTKHESLVITKKIEQHYQRACFAEIEALKPGNVHVFADGHGMQVQDFIKSAEASAAVISQPGLALGQRIYQSVDATWQTVGCNTNLGIILLCAPIIQALLQQPLAVDAENLTNQLSQVLTQTTKIDANWLFKAIKRANPGGLGQSDAHDVNDEATVTLLEAMQYSAEKDMIALQYSSNFSAIIHNGLPQYQQALSRAERSAWAITELYLYWLSRYPDSHIMRKFDLNTAQQVQAEALVHYNAFSVQQKPNQYLSALMTFDASLKKRNINPGTSADLTVATLFLSDCINAISI